MCAVMYITELDLTQKRPRSTHTHTHTHNDEVTWQTSERSKNNQNYYDMSSYYCTASIASKTFEAKKKKKLWKKKIVIYCSPPFCFFCNDYAHCYCSCNVGTHNKVINYLFATICWMTVKMSFTPSAAPLKGLSGSGFVALSGIVGNSITLLLIHKIVVVLLLC